jgi:hypothetical protein
MPTLSESSLIDPPSERPSEGPSECRAVAAEVRLTTSFLIIKRAINQRKATFAVCEATSPHGDPASERGETC